MAVSANAATFGWAAAISQTPTYVTLGSVQSIGDFSMNFATIDVSVMGTDVSRDYIAGKKSATFTITVLLDHSAHGLILGNHTSGVPGMFLIDFKDGRVAGTALITGLTFSAEQDSASSCTITGQVVGDVVISATP
jgi:predicted secreted protein